MLGGDPRRHSGEWWKVKEEEARSTGRREREEGREDVALEGLHGPGGGRQRDPGPEWAGQPRHSGGLPPVVAARNICFRGKADMAFAAKMSDDQSGHKGRSQDSDLAH